MANKAKTSFNIDANIMHLVKVKAAIENISLTEAIEKALKQYVEDIKELPQLKK